MRLCRHRRREVRRLVKECRNEKFDMMMDASPFPFFVSIPFSIRNPTVSLGQTRTLQHT
jgi:hypothetical protein